MADAWRDSNRFPLSVVPHTILRDEGWSDPVPGEVPPAAVGEACLVSEKIRSNRSATRIEFLRIVPSIGSWKLLETIRAVSGGIGKAPDSHDLFGHVEIASPSVQRVDRPTRDSLRNGEPDRSEACYSRWTERAGRVLDR